MFNSAHVAQLYDCSTAHEPYDEAHAFLRTKPLQFPPAQCAPPIPQHELVDEEASPAYNPKYFYPAKPGELLANHYQLLVKIGWGTRSTTWLAKDITRYTPDFVSVMPTAIIV